jgi:hypothetical protein
MALPSSTSPILNQSLNLILAVASNIRENGSNAVTTLAGGSVSTDYVFRLLDQLQSTIVTLNQVKNTAGLSTYATTQLPGYAGTLLTDINATIAACQACIDWVVANFPKDSTATWLMSESLNADGSRTPRQFSPAQTVGLRTALTSLIAKIG